MGMYSENGGWTVRVRNPHFDTINASQMLAVVAENVSYKEAKKIARAKKKELRKNPDNVWAKIWLEPTSSPYGMEFWEVFTLNEREEILARKAR